MQVSENSGTPKSSINRVFHYKSSILGYPYFWKHPYPNLGTIVTPRLQIRACGPNRHVCTSCHSMILSVFCMLPVYVEKKRPETGWHAMTCIGTQRTYIPRDCLNAKNWWPSSLARQVSTVVLNMYKLPQQGSSSTPTPLHWCSSHCNFEENMVLSCSSAKYHMNNINVPFQKAQTLKNMWRKNLPNV